MILNLFFGLISFFKLFAETVSRDSRLMHKLTMRRYGSVASQSFYSGRPMIHVLLANKGLIKQTLWERLGSKNVIN